MSRILRLGLLLGLLHGSAVLLRANAARAALTEDAEVQATSADPHGLLLDYGWMDRFTKGVDKFQVWRCDVPATTTDIYYRPEPWNDNEFVVRPLKEVVTWLNAHIPPYFDSVSKGLYKPTFSAGGVIKLKDHDSQDACRTKAAARTKAPFTNALAYDTVERYGAVGLGSSGALVCDPFYPYSGTCAYSSILYPPSVSGRGLVVGARGVLGKSWLGITMVVHEIGHTIGWPHSRTVDVDEYSNPFDVMSKGSNCVTWPPCVNDAIHTLAINRYQSGWIKPAQVKIYNGKTSTFKVNGPEKGGTQMVVVKLPKHKWFLTIEGRPKAGFDSILPAEGVLVHVVKNYPCTPSTFMLDNCFVGVDRWQDAAPMSDSGMEHLVSVGETLKVFGVSIRSLGATENGFQIQVSGKAVKNCGC